MYTKICEKCNLSFITYYNDRKFCSKECFNSNNRIDIICKQCNNIFNLKKSMSARKFCSNICYKEYAKNNPEECGIFIDGHKGYDSGYKNIGRKFSDESKKRLSDSLKSSDIFKKSAIDRGLKYRGEKHHKFKTGEQCGRNTIAYKEWRKNIISKFNNICSNCNKTYESKDMIAHHIKNFRNNQDLRYDINNGLLYCRGCHMKIHEIGKDTRFKKLKEVI